MAPSVNLPVEERKRLVQEHHLVTLNERRAFLSGWRNDFATISYAGSGESVEFAWPTVQHIINEKNGAFRT